jgi:hypothetical protein
MENKIQKTNRYGKFTVLDENRDLNQSHVKNLMKSIQEKNLMEYNPILVTKSLEVIDGAHRLEACKRLKLDVYYSIIPLAGIKETRLLNRANRSWFLIDYVKSYAKSGNKEMKAFLEFIEDYKIPVSTGLELYSGYFNLRRANLLRKGIIEVADVQNAHETFKKSVTLRSYFDGKPAKGRTVIRSIRKLEEKGVTFETLINKLELSGWKLKETGNVKDILRQYEDVINYKVKKDLTRLY